VANAFWTLLKMVAARALRWREFQWWVCEIFCGHGLDWAVPRSQARVLN